MKYVLIGSVIAMLFMTGVSYAADDEKWQEAEAYRLLATFGETGWFGGFATFPRTQAGRGDHVVTEGKFLNSPRPGCHPYGITKSGQEPKVVDSFPGYPSGSLDVGVIWHLEQSAQVD